MKIIILTYAKDNFEVTSMDRLIEEAKKRGHNIRRLRYSDCSMTIEDGEAKVYYKGNELLVSDAVIPWIIQGDFKYGVDVVRQFESMQDVFVLNGSVAIADACDKWRTAQILAREGIPIPDTYRALAYDAMYNHIDT